MHSLIFPNLDLIHKAIAHLYSKFGVSFVEGYRDDFTPIQSNPRYEGNGLIATQRLAADIASHFRIPVTTVIVSYSATFNQPGRVELSASNDVFVELQEKYHNNFNAVVGILAHEIAHIVLHKAAIEFTSIEENEILTDTTAAYFGMGVAILNATLEETEYELNYTRKRYQHFGYLTPSEFGYIIAKRDRLNDRDSSKALCLDRLVSAYKAGKKQMLREHKGRPFRKRPLYQRLLHRDKIGSELHILENIVFPCPRCCKHLRIPALHKLLEVKCPVCNSSHICYS
jgi:hypothetical protein